MEKCYRQGQKTKPGIVIEDTKMTDLNDRPIHPSHRQGFLLAIDEGLAVNDRCEASSRFLNALVAPGVTYAEIQAVKERALIRALDRVTTQLSIEIPETRIDTLIELFPKVRPDLRVCAECGLLDLRLKAGDWVRVTGSTCPKCSGIFRQVTFDTGVVSWVNGRTYPPGTTVDEDNIPLTLAEMDKSLLLMGVTVAPSYAFALASMDPTRSVTILDILAYMVRGAAPAERCTPLEAMRRLNDPSRFMLNPSASMVNGFIHKVMTWMQVSVAEREDGTVEVRKVEPPVLPLPSYMQPMSASAPLSVQAQVPAIGSSPIEPKVFFKQLYTELADVYGKETEIRAFLKMVGISAGSINFNDGGNLTWFSIMQQAERTTDGVRKVLLHAMEDHPVQFGKIAAGFLDVDQVEQKFGDLSKDQMVEVVRTSCKYAHLADRNRGAWDLFRAVKEHGSILDAYRKMVTMGVQFQF